MNRIHLFLQLPLVIAGCAVTQTAIAEKKSNPNIIYILADDMGYGDLGCFGQKGIKTPAIDKMAADDIRFNRHYSGSTVCAPSRCVLMTGLLTRHSKISGNQPKIELD